MEKLYLWKMILLSKILATMMYFGSIETSKSLILLRIIRDHHYSGSSSAMMEPPRNWAKKIQEEWRILEKDLPDMIYVRVYESRMDLLRAVIMGT